MKKSTKTEVVISIWAGRIGPSYWGDRDYSSLDHESTSFWLSLRRVVPNDSYLTDDGRAIGNIGLYIWVSIAGTISVDLRLHEVGSVNLYEGVRIIRKLKRLYVKGRAYPFNSFQRNADLYSELIKALDALGIRRALVYHSPQAAETYQPVGITVKSISDCVNERLDRMRNCRND